MSRNRRIAYWVSEKKAHKVNWDELQRACNKYGYEVFKVNLKKPLYAQEPFVVFLHKLTDFIASSECGDEASHSLMSSIESYLSNKRDVIVMDPIDKVRRLLNRFNCYTIIEQSGLRREHDVFTPNFCEISACNSNEIALQLQRAGIQYPFICKPTLGHGSKKAHEMMLIFNERCLHDCPTPCVAQSFVNHNAVLYKIYTIGERHHFVRRPSLKNFYACDASSICFDSSHISKAGMQNTLNTLDPLDNESVALPPDEQLIQVIARTLRDAFAMELLGIDVVIERSTGRYAIIDVNAYPGYDGYPDLYENLLKCIDDKVQSLGGGNTEKLCDNFNVHHEALTNEIQLFTSVTFG